MAAPIQIPLEIGNGIEDEEARLLQKQKRKYGQLEAAKVVDAR